MGSHAALPGLSPIVGHRGAAAHAPENTLAALRRAFELGARWVEFDVKLTRDGVPILMHDESLERTTTGRGLVADTELDLLRTLDAGVRFDRRYEGETVPSLRDALALLLELGMGVNVELKPCPGREALTAERTAATLLEHWPARAPPLLVSSFSLTALNAFRLGAPGIPRGLLVERVPRNWAELMLEFGCTTLHPWYLPTRTATVRDLARQGVPVLPYTVNDPARATRLLAAGARAVITDVPDRIAAAVAAVADLPG